MRGPGRSFYTSAVGALACLVAASCHDDGDTASRHATDEGPTPSMQAVYDELEGLEGEDRTARLVELAGSEDAELSFYTSLNVESGSVIDAFTEAYEVGVDLYRASSSTVLLRVREEASADFAGSDVILLNGTEMAALDDEGLLQPLRTPLTEDIVPEAVHDTWAGVYLNVFVAAWNTDRVDEALAPRTWDEVLTGFPGSLAMELGDFDWFATLVEDHFMAERGMSEEEAVDLFRQAASGARVVDGHTLMAELLAAGDFEVAASAYQHRVNQLADEGAPIAWEPTVEPLVVQPNGVGIARDTDAPATALLFAEFLLGDAQQLLVEFDRTPANETLDEGVPRGYDLLTVDVDALNRQRDKWETLYDEVLAQGDGS